MERGKREVVMGRLVMLKELWFKSIFYIFLINGEEIDKFLLLIF